MSKHILDGTRDRKNARRFMQYLRIEASAQPQPQSKLLQQRAQAGGAGSRTRQFLDIERRNNA